MDMLQITKRGAAPLTLDGLRRRPVGEGIVWIDLDHSDDAGMALVNELIKVAPVDLTECHARTPVPKLHVYPDHHFSAINGLARGDDERLYFQPLKTFTDSDLLITVLGPINRSLSAAAARRELSQLRGRLVSGELRPTTTLQLISAIRVDMLNAQEEIIGVVAGQIATMERDILRCDPVRSEAMLGDLFALRHDLQSIRTNAAQTYELYDHLIETLDTQPDVMQVDLNRIRDLRQGFSHLKNTADLEREYLQEMLDLFQTRVATELNRFVRKVTAGGTIAVAWTVIAGIYGMNFKNMPELSWTYGYPTALGLMLAIGAALAVMFRRSGWL